MNGRAELEGKKRKLEDLKTHLVVLKAASAQRATGSLLHDDEEVSFLLDIFEKRLKESMEKQEKSAKSFREKSTLSLDAIVLFAFCELNSM